MSRIEQSLYLVEIFQSQFKAKIQCRNLEEGHACDGKQISLGKLL